jgi:hypothetical protein
MPRNGSAQGQASAEPSSGAAWASTGATKERKVAGNPTAIVVRLYVIRPCDFPFSLAHLLLWEAQMRRLWFWITCALAALHGAVQAQEDSVAASDSKLDPTAIFAVGNSNRADFGSTSGALLHLVAGADRKPIPAYLVSELESLRIRLSDLWHPPAGAKDSQELTVDISMKLKRDGTLASPPTVLTIGESDLFKASRDSALGAIERGQPFNMLRPEHYKQWKEIVITFDPRYSPRK